LFDNPDVHILVALQEQNEKSKTIQSYLVHGESDRCMMLLRALMLQKADVKGVDALSTTTGLLAAMFRRSVRYINKLVFHTRNVRMPCTSHVLNIKLGAEVSMNEALRIILFRYLMCNYALSCFAFADYGMFMMSVGDVHDKHPVLCSLVVKTPFTIVEDDHLSEAGSVLGGGGAGAAGGM
jgi:hypothetical protein